MEFKNLTVDNMKEVIPLYMDHYNTYDECEWTEEKVYKRIHQVVTIDDAYGLILEEQGKVMGFVMGYMEQYDDLVAYDLLEIVIDHKSQGKGYGTILMTELEKRVKEKGASLLQLDSVNDEMHAHFYGKFGLRNCTNLVKKSKML